MLEFPLIAMNEPNPFTCEEVAQEWIRSVEWESGLIRDKEIYPLLSEWSNHLSGGVVLEIGSGQWVCSSKINNSIQYIGIEPSIPLVTRAIELYGNSELRTYQVGNAYQLPIESEKVDGVFSVNVWFHLGDIEKAANELARVLKMNGEFLIVTANPAAYDSFWNGCYSDIKTDWKMMIGKASVPVNPLSENTFFRHELDELTSSLEKAGLTVSSIESIGKISEEYIFIAISGSR